MKKSLGFFLVHFLVSISCVLAGTITVTSNADSGPGSFRDAVASAANGDTIDFALAIPDTIALMAEVFIKKELSILGPGEDLLTLKGNSINLIKHDEVLFVSGISFSGISSAAILSQESLIITDCRFTQLRVGLSFSPRSSFNPIIYDVTVERSWFHDNSGAALTIFLNDHQKCNLNVSYCHFFDHRELDYGVINLTSFCSSPARKDTVSIDAHISHSAIYNNLIGNPSDPNGISYGGPISTAVHSTPGGFPGSDSGFAQIFLQIDNSTISNNTAGFTHTTRATDGSAGIFIEDSGVGINGFTDITISNSSIIGNRKRFPRSIADSSTVIKEPFARNTNLEIINSVVANNILEDTIRAINYDFDDLQYLQLSDLGYNLIGYSTIPFTAPTTQSGSNFASGYLNPKVLPLGNYGGLTPTHGLLPCSPLIDAGDPNAPATDQRDSLRVGIPDIGAFEYQGTPMGMGPFAVDGTVLQSTGAPLANTKIYFIGYQASDSSVFAIDSATTNATGAYTASVNALEFYIKAAPDSATYPTEMPTYADASLTFQGARLICGSETIDFSTLAGGNPGGPGFIGGLLSQGAGKKSDPLGGITLLLYDPATMQALDVTTSNADGYFSFADLPLGDYEVWVDKPIIDNGVAPMVSLTAQSSVQDSLPFFLHSTYLELRSMVGVEDGFIKIRHTVFPNPAKDQLTFEVASAQGSSFQLEIFDLMGKKVWEDRFAESISIDLVGFSAGVYTYRLTDADRRSVQGKVVVWK